MGKLNIVRPDSSFSDDNRKTLEKYLADHWRRAKEGRADQLDRYSNWEKNYRAIPAEEIRNVPWYNSSNFVVPLIRIFLDTFVARTLNIVFATRPLFVTDSFPREVREGLEMYLNQKALAEWEMYTLFRDMLTRGNKNGTAVIKTIQRLDVTNFVSSGQVSGTNASSSFSSTPITMYDGPCSAIVSFEDIAFYPHTANYMRDVRVTFNRIRYVEEDAKDKWYEEQWPITEEELDNMLRHPNDDLKRDEQAVDAGVYDPYLKELHTVECHLEWRIAGEKYSIVALLEEGTEKLLDVYFNPYPCNWKIFQDYRPFPREDFIYGESMCELLQQAQEETSWIHNDRRNNSYLANAPVFKRRQGSLLPNPSTNWYPGKVFDLESLEDLDVISIGRNYSDTLAEENWDLQLSERLSGIGAVMQGYAAGMMGKRGIYNATGTMAIMQESNQRQDTNIRDAREVLSAVMRTHLMFQAQFSKDDPVIETYPQALQDQVRTALGMVTPQNMRYSRFEVKASDAGSNKEVSRQNLMQLAGVVSNYGGAVQQMVGQLANPQLNPAIRSIMEQTLTMMKWMATRLLRAYDEYDAEGVLPDAATALSAAQAQGPNAPGGAPGAGPTQGPPGGFSGMVNGGSGAPVSALSREGLAALLVLPGGNGNSAGAPGVGPEAG